MTAQTSTAEQNNSAALVVDRSPALNRRLFEVSKRLQRPRLLKPRYDFILSSRISPVAAALDPRVIAVNGILAYVAAISRAGRGEKHV